MDAHHTTISSNRAQPMLTVEAVKQFQEGIDLLLSRWTALQMAVQNQWGGPHSHLRARQIIVDIFSLFTQSKGIEMCSSLWTEGLRSSNFLAVNAVCETIDFFY